MSIRWAGIRSSHRPHRRATSTVVAIVLATASLGVTLAAYPSFATQSLSVAASEDTQVWATKPNKSFGSAGSMHVDGAPVARSYVKFTLRGLTTPIEKAELRLVSTTGSNGVVVSTTTTTWHEATLTMNTSPRPTSVVGDAASTAKAKTATIDVTSAISGDGTYAFVLTSAESTRQAWGTKESGHAAVLVLTTADPDSTTSSSTSTSSSSTTTTTTTTTPNPDPGARAFPIRAAFYYPWFPEAWKQNSVSPYTWFSPSLGLYDSSNLVTISKHIGDMQYAGLDAGIASWWGQGSRTDGRVSSLLRAASPTTFRWTLYYEPEGTADPTVSQIDSDLSYVNANYASDPSFLRVGGRPVIFVYGDTADGCSMVDRWTQANRSRFYVVLKVFSGYRHCGNQPNSWHQYAPAVRADSQVGYSYSVSPGFRLRSESTPRLSRDLTAFASAVQAMAASNAPFQLVTTFNEWGEGTAVEPAQEWASSSTEGAYLDILHQYLGGTSVPVTDPVITAAGDIACDPADGNFKAGAGSSSACRMKATSDILGTVPNLAGILTLGDNQYEQGQLDNYNVSYAPTWGRYVDKTFPTPGNHEYMTSAAAGYYQYFGQRAGDPSKGYYSYDIGKWHLVALNGNCTEAGGCGKTSPQVTWLTWDLAANPTACTLAYWHQPRFSSGEHGNNANYDTLWRALDAAGVEIVLNGHDHDYERFHPQNPDGVATPTGIREFVVGTGGKSHYGFSTIAANSAARNGDTFGLLQLALHPTSYDWQFLAESGKNFTDRGTTACH